MKHIKIKSANYTARIIREKETKKCAHSLCQSDECHLFKNESKHSVSFLSFGVHLFGSLFLLAHSSKNNMYLFGKASWTLRNNDENDAVILWARYVAPNSPSLKKLSDKQTIYSFIPSVTFHCFDIVHIVFHICMCSCTVVLLFCFLVCTGCTIGYL